MNIDIIQKRLKIINDLQAELNKVKDHYEDSLNNNPVIQEAQQQEEEMKKKKEETKAKVEKVKESPMLKSMMDQMKELKEDMKNNKEALSQELADYYRESGSMEIADEEGNTKRIKFTARLTNN